MSDKTIKWIKNFKKKNFIRTKRINFSSSGEWIFKARSIFHKERGYFSIKGFSFRSKSLEPNSIDLPLIDQPEIGLLGFIVKEVNSKFYILFQLKAEPGNKDVFQLAPTVQATESNYMMVHKGEEQPYFEIFKQKELETLYDSLQTEQGWRFFQKRNNNRIIKTLKDLKEKEGYKWIELKECLDLLNQNYIVNSDSRSVLSAFFLNYGHKYLAFDNNKSLHNSIIKSLKVKSENKGSLLSWYFDFCARTNIEFLYKTFKELKGWQVNKNKISRNDGKLFEIIQVKVDTNCREISHWDQPMISTKDIEKVILVGKQEKGTLKFLVRLTVEPGLINKAGISPTFQINNHQTADTLSLDLLKKNKNKLIKEIKVKNSEEGGRFFNDLNEHSVVIYEDFDIPELHATFKWLTLMDLKNLINIDAILTNEMRSLISIAFTLLKDENS